MLTTTLDAIYNAGILATDYDKLLQRVKPTSRNARIAFTDVIDALELAPALALIGALDRETFAMWQSFNRWNIDLCAAYFPTPSINRLYVEYSRGFSCIDMLPRAMRESGALTSAEHAAAKALFEAVQPDPFKTVSAVVQSVAHALAAGASRKADLDQSELTWSNVWKDTTAKQTAKVRELVVAGRWV